MQHKKIKWNSLHRNGLNTLTAMTIVFLMTACPEPPEFDFVPSISFHKVEFYNVTETDPTGTDTLKVSINFQDGNGDLGLTPNDVEPPYHPFEFVLNNDSNPVTYAERGRTPSFNPINYVYDTILWRGNELIDTFYIERNENFYNIIVDFYVKRQGQWQFFDTEAAPYYTTFNGRFPILNTENYERPLEGVLTYKMNSAGFRSIFRQDSVRIEVKIKDRALNNSNKISTPAFTLPQVTVIE